MRKVTADAVVGVALGLLALVVYVATLSSGAYPGESAQIMQQSLGLFPWVTCSHPLWIFLTRVITALVRVSDPALPLNLLSAVFGAGGVALLYWIISTAIRQWASWDLPGGRHVLRAAIIGGVSGSLAAAFCVPFWIASNRCHWMTFHVWLLLVAIRLFQQFTITGRQRTALFLACFYGIGIVENTAFIVLAPLLAICLMSVLWRQEKLNPRTGSLLVASLLAGLMLYFIAAAWFRGTPGYAIREMDGYFQIVWHTWRDQWRTIARSVPYRGWLIVVILTVVPWLTVLGVARRGLNEERDLSFYGLHAVLTALTLAVLLNMRMAPWSMFGFGRFMVMPYILTAMVFGYLAAYWYLLPAMWFRDTRSGIGKGIRKGLGTVLAVGCVGVVSYLPFRNFWQADARGTKVLRQFCEATIQCLDGRQWLATDGTLDSLLEIEALRLNVPLHCLSLRAGAGTINRNYTATLFADPHLQNLAKLSTSTLLNSWIRSDSSLQSKLAIQNIPDIFLAGDYVSVPSGLVFHGVKQLADVDGDAAMRRAVDLWADWEAVLEQEPLANSHLALFARYLRRQLSFTANNLGVLMQDLDRPHDAAAAYRQSRQFDPGNISALLNIYAMTRKDPSVADAAAIRADMARLDENRKQGGIELMSLSRSYGYVRSPTVFARMGWAMSGQPGLAGSGLRRAIGLADESDRGPLRQALAGLYLMQDNPAESETLYYELLVENPNNHVALLGMARVEMTRGHFEIARDYLARATSAGVPESLMELEWAALHIADGNLTSARERLETILKDQPMELRAWAMLTSIAIQERDEGRLSAVIKEMSRLKGGHEFLLALARGYLGIIHEDVREAADAFEAAYVINPNNTLVLDKLIRLDTVRGLNDSAEARARRLLQLDSNHAYANYCMARLQIQRGELARARDSLTRSIQANPNAPALNDLAWLLFELGDHAAAESRVREALAMDDSLAAAWDTLGAICLAEGRLDEARIAMDAALTHDHDDAGIQLRLAEVALAQGDVERASALIAGLKPQTDDLDKAGRERLKRLTKQIERN